MEREVTMEAMNEKITEVQFQLSEIHTTLATHSEQIKGALRRIDEQAQLTETVHNLATSIQLLVAKQEITTEKVAETNKKLEDITSKVSDLEQKPARKWEHMVKTLIGGIVAGVLAYMLAKLGLG